MSADMGGHGVPEKFFLNAGEKPGADRVRHRNPPRIIRRRVVEALIV